MRNDPIEVLVGIILDLAILAWFVGSIWLWTLVCFEPSLGNLTKAMALTAVPITALITISILARSA